MKRSDTDRFFGPIIVLEGGSKQTASTLINDAKSNQITF